MTATTHELLQSVKPTVLIVASTGDGMDCLYADGHRVSCAQEETVYSGAFFEFQRLPVVLVFLNVKLGWEDDWPASLCELELDEVVF